MSKRVIFCAILKHKGEEFDDLAIDACIITPPPS